MRLRTFIRTAQHPSTHSSGGLRFEFRIPRLEFGNPRFERGRMHLDFRLGEAREGKRTRRLGDWETGDREAGVLAGVEGAGVAEDFQARS